MRWRPWRGNILRLPKLAAREKWGPDVEPSLRFFEDLIFEGRGSFRCELRGAGTWKEPVDKHLAMAEAVK